MRTSRTDFNPLPPHGGRLVLSPGHKQRELISIHSLRMEGDYLRLQRESVHRHFNPLPPHGGRPALNCLVLPPGHISIHSLRMEGDIQLDSFQQAAERISIHSLRMEGDILTLGICAAACISIHSLRMEGDPAQNFPGFPTTHFNPLPPHGGRLAAEYHLNDAQRDFNPLPPHGGRRNKKQIEKPKNYFNPLPPHGGRPSGYTGC